MPGETVGDALRACIDLSKQNIGGILTRLGENVRDHGEAEAVTDHYLRVLDAVRTSGLPIELSVKLTQLGLDLDVDRCLANLRRLAHAYPSTETLWIDMEQSDYVDWTLAIFRRARTSHRNLGLCVQAYLFRTETDVEGLIADGAAVRLVKGAYREPPARAFPKRKDVDENFFRLAQKLLGPEARRNSVRAALATHDLRLIRRIAAWATFEGLDNSQLEFQMLYGIQRPEQARLAQQGYHSRVLVAYGSWFPWYMRRLAERPANVLFVAKNLFVG
jgi:proline dehydrogenase